MSVDQAIVRRIAQLARIRVSDEEVPHLEGELNAIRNFGEKSMDEVIEALRAHGLSLRRD